jgi:hypothetical protein
LQDSRRDGYDESAAPPIAPELARTAATTKWAHSTNEHAVRSDIRQTSFERKMRAYLTAQAASCTSSSSAGRLFVSSPLPPTNYVFGDNE